MGNPYAFTFAFTFWFYFLIASDFNMLNSPNTSGGTYLKVKPDGANFRCSECGQRYPHLEVILFEHTETHKRSLICLGCVDREWMASARCIGNL